MKNLSKLLLLTPFLLVSFSSNAVSPQRYNMGCVAGGSIQGFDCKPDRLTNAQAHSYCVNFQSNSANQNSYLDCMGSFMPFTDTEERTSQSCDITFTYNRSWGESKLMTNNCIGPIPVKNYADGETVTLTNVREGLIGTADFSCVNGNMTLDRSTSICVKEAQQCDLADINTHWRATHMAAIGEHKTTVHKLPEVTNGTIGSNDWFKLNMTGVLNSIKNTNCQVNNLTGQAEMFERVLTVPSSTRDINDTSLYFSRMIVDDASIDYFGDLPSYKVEYCYDGNIANTTATNYFHNTLNKLYSNNLIDGATYQDLLTPKCTVSIPDCSAASMVKRGNDGSVCRFETQPMRHGDNPNYRTVFQTIGSRVNPAFFGVEDEYHGRAEFSCFAGRVTNESSECHLTPRCNNKPTFGNGTVNVYSPRFTVQNPSNRKTDRELIAEAIESRRPDLQAQCDSFSIEGLGGSLTSISSEDYIRNIKNSTASMELKAECAYATAPTNLCKVGKQTITDAFLENNNVDIDWRCENGLVDIGCNATATVDFPDPVENPVLFTDEWVIAGAVTEGGRSLGGGDDFSRFDMDHTVSYVLPDIMTKNVVISLDRVRLAANAGDHSSRGGNATGRARDAFNEYGCSESVRLDFEEFSYTRSQSFGTNRHYGVVIGRCPCSASSNIEQCEQGTQPAIFSSGGGGGGGTEPPGSGDPEIPENEL